MDQQVETLQQQLKEQEKLAALGMLSAGIAHEIQNPLNFVINFSKMSGKLIGELTEIVDDNKGNISDDDRADLQEIMTDLQDNIARIEEHSQRAVGIVRDILLVARGKADERLPTDVGRIVKEYVWLAYHAMRASRKGFNISIREDYQPDIPPQMVVPQEISRAVLNLMNNACYTVWRKSAKAPADYQPTIDISVATQGTELVISIADNGEGMSPEVQRRLYENFYTTKPIGEGTGLGMTITRDIVEHIHGGRLSFQTKEGEGTCFTMTIPLTNR